MAKIVHFKNTAFEALATNPRVTVTRGRGRGGPVLVRGTYGEGLTVSPRSDRNVATVTVPASLASKVRTGHFLLDVARTQVGPGVTYTLRPAPEGVRPDVSVYER